MPATAELPQLCRQRAVVSVHVIAHGSSLNGTIARRSVRETM